MYFPHGDVIDTRDLCELQEELRAEEDLTDEDQALLEELDAAEDSISDWQEGETLIAEHYFVEYAQQLAGEIGAIDPDAGWPLTYIDWDAAADALKQDYFEVEIDGTTYYGR